MIVATNRNLEQWCQAGRFRADLLYRIRALTIDLPPLREHPEDIGELVIYHANELCKRHQIVNKGLSPEFFEVLSSYHWPGNVRELIKTLDVAIASAGSSQIIFPKHLPEYIRIDTIKNNIRKNSKSNSRGNKASGSSPSFPNFHDNKTCDSPASLPTLKQFRKAASFQAEKQYLQELITHIPGNIEAACQVSELSRSRLYELIKIHNISI